jgi:hypothetical protein
VAFCTECGTPHETGQRFCANCGSQLGGVITKTAPVGALVPVRAPVTGMSILSFVLGLLSLVGTPGFLALLFIGPMLLGAFAIIAGLFAHRAAQEKGFSNDGLATAGIVLGIIGTVLGAVLLITLRSPWAL